MEMSGQREALPRWIRKRYWWSCFRITSLF